jgi:hypothetical protein
MCGRWSTRAVITRPRVSSDWLMLPASRARASFAPLRPTLSLPARSTRFSFPILMTSSPASLISREWMVRVKTQCDRLLCALHAVSAVARFAMPRPTYAYTSSALFTGISSRFCTLMPDRLSSTILRRSPPAPPRPIATPAPPPRAPPAPAVAPSGSAEGADTPSPNRFLSLPLLATGRAAASAMKLEGSAASKSSRRCSSRNSSSRQEAIDKWCTHRPARHESGFLR